MLDSLRSRRGGVALVLAGMFSLLLGGLFAPGASAGTNAPPGNNGTIKVEDDTSTPPENEPHVPCDFILEWRSLDNAGHDLTSTVTFELQAPTLRAGNDQTVLTDTVKVTNADGPGATHLDQSKHYTLPFGDVEPHPIQGYHVKVTVHTEGSQGADVKHKVFWVGPCEITPEEATTTTSTTTKKHEENGGSTTTIVTSSTLLGNHGTTPPGPNTQVLGETLTAPTSALAPAQAASVSTTPGVSVLGTSLARTGLATGWLTLFGLGALVVGAALLATARRGETV